MVSSRRGPEVYIQGALKKEEGLLKHMQELYEAGQMNVKPNLYT